MNGFQNIKRQLLPLIKGLPIVVFTLLGALFIAQKVVQYTPNTYQTIARIKLDDQKYGFSNTALYSDFDVFTTENKIQAEAAVLKSPLLLRMALDSLDFSTSLYRKGRIRNTMLYGDSPIIVTYDFVNEQLFDKDYFIQVLDENQYRLVNEEGEYAGFETKALGVPTLLDGGLVSVSKNEATMASRDYQLSGQYILHVFSEQGLIKDISERLDVVEVDKEMPIIRVVYKDRHPKKVADLANALCNVYITDYVATKSAAAQQTVRFIDEKINEVQVELNRSEIALEQYKAVNGVVNTRQETETGLRQISSLEVQLFNLEMNEKSILELEAYISEGDYFNETAINFGFGDLLMTELVKKLKLWQDERIDLLLKYTEDSDRVLAVDQKILELKNYIREAISRNKAEIITKRTEIENVVAEASTQFEGLSTREKELRILERNFHLQEQVYNFLSQKKIEASIAASANLAFHRIIEEAVAPQKPVSPNGTLITFVSGLLGLMIGIAFIYLRKSGLARVTDRQDIERHTDLPILGLVRSGDDREDFMSVIKNLQLKGFLNSNTVLAVTSTVRNEGKTYVVEHLAQNLFQSGLSVAVVNMSEEANTEGVDSFLLNPEVNENGITVLSQPLPTQLNWKDRLAQLKTHFDIVVLDAPAAAVSVEGIDAMKCADASLYLVRANKTSVDYLSHAEQMKEEYVLENVLLLLNDAHRASSHSGVFVGTGFRSASNRLGLKLRLSNYFNTYMR